MCVYRKSIFQCNHTTVSSEPIAVCLTQQDHLSSLPPTLLSPRLPSPPTSIINRYTVKPCDIVRTHMCSTVRVPRACDPCAAKKAALDRTFTEVRAKMAALRQHIETTYGDCLVHLDDAGLNASSAKIDSMRAEKEEMQRGRRLVRLGEEGSINSGKGEVDVGKTTKEVKKEEEAEKKRDPVEEFLRMKKAEKYSHLMMLG